jgi:hypothetical protein
VIETFASDAPEKAFANGIHQRRLHRGSHDASPDAPGPTVEDRTERIAAVADALVRLLVGSATNMASGCTSGHGVSGMSRFVSLATLMGPAFARVMGPDEMHEPPVLVMPRAGGRGLDRSGTLRRTSGSTSHPRGGASRMLNSSGSMRCGSIP